MYLKAWVLVLRSDVQQQLEQLVGDFSLLTVTQLLCVHLIFYGGCSVSTSLCQVDYIWTVIVLQALIQFYFSHNYCGFQHKGLQLRHTY